jgi:hypothetical protein
MGPGQYMPLTSVMPSLANAELAQRYMIKSTDPNDTYLRPASQLFTAPQGSFQEDSPQIYANHRESTHNLICL